MEIGERPWGKYFVLADESNYKLKRVEVFSKQRLSYQYHNKRQEAWTIIQGTAKVTLDDVETIYKYGETVLIPLGSKHRIENIGDDILIFIEVQTGTYFGEDDIVRLQDDYARE
ncbi:phosphomannose isomerase type II C-terminal cupin domain [Riemerella anatipestifer]|uniref:phosphomannose isomerase type II C-terminal cupin domain n=1 Tax=Riemerella anatipestifer TaxID=34085 RepID=UPI00066A4062|nr:phosphomannose isomerase type II C-terminal cupin domain [Riemerella anatipestifer]AKP71261.1 mannose-6-phosphate isomerase [Riemerella anatipestifer]MDY3502094.1 phosphomannose isomerase type II C-terminal cupin domain [Riemerella anatipestifer]OBP43583.1 mannose-6-phosphate isomerase [Riemerella anatipestifer]OBP47307.1 mannose-6-phosphate isomerase [Riemerella anatipestifer]